MKNKLLFILLVSNLCLTKAFSQTSSDTLVYEFVDMWPKGDTSFIKTYSLKDSKQVREEYFGHSFDLTSITINSIDTFIVTKSYWQKVFNGKVYPFLSIVDFDKNKTVIEHIRDDKRFDITCSYTPVDKQIINGDLILCYDMDIIYGKHVKYDDTRVYFSFRYGIVGYLSMSNPIIMVLKEYKDSLKMNFRPFLSRPSRVIPDSK